MSPQTSKKEMVRKAKGMHDILADEYFLRQKFLDKAAAIVEFYGFEPIQTPILEKAELFTSTVGENTDIVEKEMYSLKTKGGEKLVLRPEGTAPIVRAYIENGMQAKPQPVMLFYQGSFFRHERPQKGRRREHQQLGLEILGDKDSIADATVIKAMFTILEEAAGIKSLTLRLNSIGDRECRKNYQKELLIYYKKQTRHLCSDCLRRIKTNPFRLLDCKEEKCSEIKKEAPQIISYLCSDCTSHFKELLEILEASAIPYYLDHYLVRGLDYYSRTTFEFVREDGLALGGGGRYDSLAYCLNNKEIPAIGGALGVDRIIETLKGNRPVLSQPSSQKPIKVFFIQLGAEAKHKSLFVLEILRHARIPTKHSLSKDSLKSQLNIAAKLKAVYALILGQKEALEDSIMVRNMETATQETVAIEKLAEYLKKTI